MKTAYVGGEYRHSPLKEGGSPKSASPVTCSLGGRKKSSDRGSEREEGGGGSPFYERGKRAKAADSLSPGLEGKARQDTAPYVDLAFVGDDGKRRGVVAATHERGTTVPLEGKRK